MAGAASGPLSLLDDIRAQAKKSGVICTTGDFIKHLNADQRDAMSAARAEGIQTATIARWLQTLGYKGTEDSAARHLVGRCACPRT